jgi:hypothetical protein
MNDQKKKAELLLGMTLYITRLKSSIEDYSRLDPTFKRQLLLQIKALDSIDAIVDTESMKLGVDPEDF